MEGAAEHRTTLTATNFHCSSCHPSFFTLPSPMESSIEGEVTPWVAVGWGLTSCGVHRNIIPDVRTHRAPSCKVYLYLEGLVKHLLGYS